MKLLSACLYCNKKKDCPESVGAHSFLDSCFEAENEHIRDALKNLQVLSKYHIPVEVLQKVNGVAGVLIEQEGNMEKLARRISMGGCAAVCLHGGPCRYETDQTFKECFECEDPCPCRDCFDGEKFKLDWSKTHET